MRNIIRIRAVPGGNYFLENEQQGERHTLTRVVVGANGKRKAVWESPIGVASADEMVDLLILFNRCDVFVQRG